ncbi:unnamed protein product [Pleuronectes platessa]|uniref:Secreted protein n=1 Tax=Pleuronectes platessa TaxID=8262 RepID=A0A9N7VYV6_PLEPL|nr:unnamed protein product [Pleuronectes platessa]
MTSTAVVVLFWSATFLQRSSNDDNNNDRLEQQGLHQRPGSEGILPKESACFCSICASPLPELCPTQSGLDSAGLFHRDTDSTRTLSRLLSGVHLCPLPHFSVCKDPNTLGRYDTGHLCFLPSVPAQKQPLSVPFAPFDWHICSTVVKVEEIR